MGVYTLTPADTEYPENLREVSGLFDEIYVRGTLIPEDKKAIAIVGTRALSDWGRETAHEYAAYLAQHGVTIVSGLARGIDTVAHHAALAAGGRTIAVLGTGVDVMYPAENKELAGKIVRRGALVSQFPLGTTPKRHHFLMRNDIIAGLSVAVLVVEGKAQSGTISIAHRAVNINRDVFVVPRDPSHELFEGPQYLLERGAAVVESPEMLLEWVQSKT